MGSGRWLAPRSHTAAGGSAEVFVGEAKTMEEQRPVHDASPPPAPTRARSNSLGCGSCRRQTQDPLCFANGNKQQDRPQRSLHPSLLLFLKNGEKLPPQPKVVFYCISSFSIISKLVYRIAILLHSPCSEPPCNHKTTVEEGDN